MEEERIQVTTEDLLQWGHLQRHLNTVRQALMADGVVCLHKDSELGECYVMEIRGTARPRTILIEKEVVHSLTRVLSKGEYSERDLDEGLVIVLSW